MGGTFKSWCLVIINFAWEFTTLWTLMWKLLKVYLLRRRNGETGWPREKRRRAERTEKRGREAERQLTKGRASASISWCLIYHPFHCWIWCHYSLHINQELKLRAQLTLLPITPTLCRHKNHFLVTLGGHHVTVDIISTATVTDNNYWVACPSWNMKE